MDTISHIGGLVAGILLGFFLTPVKWWSNSTKCTNKKILLLYLSKLLCGCIFGLLMGLLVHQFSTSKLDQVRLKNVMRYKTN